MLIGAPSGDAGEGENREIGISVVGQRAIWPDQDGQASLCRQPRCLQVPLILQTGGFASPPLGGFAFFSICAVGWSSCAEQNLQPVARTRNVSRKGDRKGRRKREAERRNGKGARQQPQRNNAEKPRQPSPQPGAKDRASICPAGREAPRHRPAGRKGPRQQPPHRACRGIRRDAVCDAGAHSIRIKTV